TPATTPHHRREPPRVRPWRDSRQHVSGAGSFPPAEANLSRWERPLEATPSIEQCRGDCGRALGSRTGRDPPHCSAGGRPCGLCGGRVSTRGGTMRRSTLGLAFVLSAVVVALSSATASASPAWHPNATGLLDCNGYSPVQKLIKQIPCAEIAANEDDGFE